MEITAFPGVKSRNCLIETVTTNEATYKIVFGYDTPEEVVKMIDDKSGIVIARNTSKQCESATVQHYLAVFHTLYDLTTASDVFEYDASYNYTYDYKEGIEC